MFGPESSGPKFQPGMLDDPGVFFLADIKIGVSWGFHGAFSEVQ